MQNQYGLGRSSGDSRSFELKAPANYTTLGAYGKPRNLSNSSYEDSYSNNSAIPFAENHLDESYKRSDFGRGSNPKDNTWEGSFGQWNQVAGLGFKGLDLYNQIGAGKLAKQNFALQKRQVEDNRNLTLATAQRGIEDSEAQRYARGGLSGVDARKRAEESSLNTLSRYGLV